MEAKIQRVIEKFYGKLEPIDEVSILHWSPQAEIVTVRWQRDGKTVTVKAIFDREGLHITELK